MYSNKLICDILFYIDKNINNKINIQDIADIFFFNRFYIMKLFKKELGISINNYINLKRILHSHSNLKNTDDSYLTIALNNGFNSLEYFSETFKLIIGVSPRVYKKFTYFIIKIKDEEINTIRSNLLKLTSTINKIDNYINNLKSDINIEKKLSIF